MEIKKIFDAIAAESSTNQKMKMLSEYKEHEELLKRVLYLANSKRVKFYIKQIPEYKSNDKYIDLKYGLDKLAVLSNRELTGDVAREHLSIILSELHPDDAYIVERIIDKDTKVGLGTRMINKVFPDLIESTPYMGAKPYDIKLIEKLIAKGPAKSQVKMDGSFANCIIRDGEVEIVSRAGEQVVLTGSKLVEELSTLTDEMVLNGELTILGVPIRRIANGIINSLIDIQSKVEERGEVETQKKIKKFLLEHAVDFGDENITYQEILDRVTYTSWDLITVEEYYNKKSTRPYDERLKQLSELINSKNCTRVNLIESRDVTTVEEAMQHFSELLNMGLEGTILKEGKGEWKNGKGNNQIKFKLEIHLDLKIVGFQMGTKGTKNENVVSTLLLESSCGQLKTNPSGMNEKMMEDVTKRQEELLGTVVEIRCCGLSQDSKGNWSTLHPSVEELRTDKTTCDSLESAIAIENAAKGVKLNTN